MPSTGALVKARSGQYEQKGRPPRARNQTTRGGEDRFRLLFDQAVDGIFLADSAGHYLDVNTAGCEMLGYSREEILARSIADVIAPEEQARIGPEIARFAGGKITRSEWHFVRKDGSRFIGEVVGRQLPDGQLQGILRDIGERRRAEDALRSVALFPEENPSPVARVDAEGKLLFANRASSGLLAQWQCAVGNRVPEAVSTAVREVLQAGSARELEIESGGRRISFVLMPILERGYVNLYGRDVTEQRRTQEKLRKSEEKYRSLFNSLDDGFCIIQVLFGEDGRAQDYRFLEVNPAFERHSGLQGVAGKRIRELVPNQDAHWFETYGRVALTGEPKRFSTEGEALKRFFEVYAFRVGDPEERKVAVLFRDETQRKRAEDAVREKAEELRAVLDAAPVAVWIAQDPECRVITGNAYADDLIMGTPRGGNISRSAPAGEAAVTYRAFRDGVELRPEELPAQRATATGKPVPAFDMELVFPDGRKLSLLAGAVPLFDAAGAVRGAIAAGLDVTALKKAQEELRQAEERTRFALQAGRMGTWDRKMPDGPTVWNEDHYRILGYDPAQVTPSKEAWAARVHPDDLRVFYEHLSEVLKHGGDFSEELRIVRPDGTVRWVELRGCIQCDANGQPKRSCGVILDFTDRRTAEQALRKSEEHFRSITNTTPVMMWMTDATGAMEFVNRAYCEFFGVTLEHVSAPGKWQPLVHPEDLAKYSAAFSVALETRSPFVAEARVRRPDGQWRWIQSYGAPRFNENREFLGMVVSSPDVTERREFQAELERLVADRTNKLQELVGELEYFSYTITHDLKAPLRAMRAFAELAGAMCEENDYGQARQFLGRITSSAERMDNLIADALRYSKSVREELSLERVDADALLRGILDSYPELQPDRARILVEGRLPMVLANQAGLTQCFSNLLGNAVKFVKRGERPDIRVWAGAADGWARIWVEDRGIGIAQEMLPRVFDMFARGTNDYEGTGIGLALVRKVVQRMGGRVGVHSKPGEGSQFWLELRSA